MTNLKEVTYVIHLLVDALDDAVDKLDHNEDNFRAIERGMDISKMAKDFVRELENGT